MKKTVIKCDVCKKEITEGGFYNFTHENIPGWAQFYSPHPYGIAGEFQLCQPCVEKRLGINKS